MQFHELLTDAQQGDYKALARLISFIENQVDNYRHFLSSLTHDTTSCVIGITGPPGAGKSTLTDCLVKKLITKEKKVAVLCIDPSSPFSTGALLGDRIRMQQWYSVPEVYIRSLASRGALGGIGPMTIEITEILKACDFDYIIIETVGVGQNEVDIAALADVTTVVLVPESGDEIQTMKSGLIEIADLFVINKSDRPGAERIKMGLLSSMQTMPDEMKRPVVETTATNGKGIDLWLEEINKYTPSNFSDKKIRLLAEKAWQLIVKEKMKEIDKEELVNYIKQSMNQMNLYSIVNKFI